MLELKKEIHPSSVSGFTRHVNVQPSGVEPGSGGVRRGAAEHSRDCNVTSTWQSSGLLPQAHVKLVV